MILYDNELIDKKVKQICETIEEILTNYGSTKCCKCSLKSVVHLNQEDKIKFIEDFEKKTYHIRTKCEYVGYYTIKAKDLDEAESIAQTKLLSEMNIEVDGSFDFRKFDPNESD